MKNKVFITAGFDRNTLNKAEKKHAEVLLRGLLSVLSRLDDSPTAAVKSVSKKNLFIL